MLSITILSIYNGIGRMLLNVKITIYTSQSFRNRLG